MKETGKYFFGRSAIHSSVDVSLDEVIALLRHAIDKGVDKSNKVVIPLRDALNEILDQKDKYQSPGEFLPTVIVEKYKALVTLTYPITGKTILGGYNSRKYLRRIGTLAFVLLLIILFDGFTDVYLNDIDAGEEGWQYWLKIIQNDFINIMIPFVWGALGSCVYLMKLLSDLYQTQTFDADKFHGSSTRILLGAILGGFVQYIYSPESFTSESLTLDANAMAFLTGVGVKVFYGALEKLIAELAKLLKLPSDFPKQQQSINEFLLQQLESLEAESDSAKVEYLHELMDKTKTT